MPGPLSPGALKELISLAVAEDDAASASTSNAPEPTAGTGTPPTTSELAWGLLDLLVRALPDVIAVHGAFMARLAVARLHTRAPTGLRLLRLLARVAERADLHQVLDERVETTTTATTKRGGVGNYHEETISSALQAVCLTGSTTVAKSAARVLALAAPRPVVAQLMGDAAETVRNQASTLHPEAPRLATALQTVAPFARFRPVAVPSPHAPDLVSSLLDHVLAARPDTLVVPSRSSTSTSDTDTDAASAALALAPYLTAPITSRWGRDGTAPRLGVALKARALKTVVRLVTPEARRPGLEVADDHRRPASLLELSANTVVPWLERAADPFCEDVPGPFGDDHTEAEAGWLRVVAFRGLLRIMRIWEHRAPHAAYGAVAMCVQDPLPDVRELAVRGVALRVVQLSQAAHIYPNEAPTAAKMAAILCLAVVDPVSEHRHLAAEAIQGFVRARRIAIHGAGMPVRAYPEMVLPFALALLAHHPDLPLPECAVVMNADANDDDGETTTTRVLPDAALLSPFTSMLAALVVPLVAATPGLATAGETLPLMVRLLRLVKHTEDATGAGEEISEGLRMLADAGLWLVRSSHVLLSATSRAAADLQANTQGTTTTYSLASPPVFRPETLRGAMLGEG